MCDLRNALINSGVLPLLWSRNVTRTDAARVPL
jgi:hypothetical protein